MMPALFVILILLVGYATSTPGFRLAEHFLFDFNVHKITTGVVIDALGHAFFSLAVGAGCMLVYGSYLSSKTPIGSTSIIITLLNLLVALLSGLAIFPLVFTHHLMPSGGPGLMFQTLPIAFSHMGWGRLYGFLFFLLLLFAAWTSSISLAEPLVILLMERFKLSRGRSSVLIGVCAWLLGIGSTLSFNVWSHYRLLGRWNFFDVVTDLATNIMLPVGGLLFAVFVGWKMHEKSTKAELGISGLVYQFWLFLVKYICPVGIVIILISSII